MVMRVWGLTGGTLVERRGSCEAQSAAWPSLLARARPGQARKREQTKTNSARLACFQTSQQR